MKTLYFLFLFPFYFICSVYSYTNIFYEEKDNQVITNSVSSTKSGTSTIYFVRLEGGNIELFHKEKYIGEIKSKEYLKYTCSSGHQLFWASSENKEFLIADLKEDCNYIVLVRPVKFSGFWKVHVELLPITSENKDYYNKAKMLINKSVPKVITKAELESVNIKLEKFIEINLAKYEIEWKGIRNFKQINSEMCIQKNILKN